MRVLVLNGPNLNLLGSREPELYGRESLEDVESQLRSVAGELGVDIEFAQHNGEGEIIDAIQGMKGRFDAALINAGAYSHTSLAIHDALTSIAIPFAEVHITNIFAREPERRKSMLSDAAVGMLCGFGTKGYELALRGLISRLGARG